MFEVSPGRRGQSKRIFCWTACGRKLTAQTSKAGVKLKTTRHWIAGRYGKIRRQHLWVLAGPDEMPELRVLSSRVRNSFCRAVATGKIAARLPVVSDDPLLIKNLSVHRYLQICKICYRSIIFPERPKQSAIKLYRGFSDGRHGGLPDLPPRSVSAFREWHGSELWSGCHPWEIWRDRVMLSVHPCPVGQGEKSYFLWLRSFYGDVVPELVAMAVALLQAKVPFVMRDAGLYAKFASGKDWLGVAEDRVLERGGPIWPKGAGILGISDNEKSVSQLAPIPGAMACVRWFPGRRVPFLPYSWK